jgi:uncharacterized protein YtpQ (UPF0354 family)
VSGLNLTLETLKDISLQNLSEYGFKITKNKNIYIITAGGYYESSLILLNIWNKETFPVEGELVIGIPSRDVVLVTGSRDSEGLHAVYDIVKNINDTGNHLVANKLFEYKNGEFEIFQL